MNINPDIKEELAVRIPVENPNHHLWNNHGVWWTHFTVHRSDYTKKRIRLSLGTRDLEQARRLRDLFLTGFTDTAGALNN
jgi:hypothetical protein